MYYAVKKIMPSYGAADLWLLFARAHVHSLGVRADKRGWLPSRVKAFVDFAEAVAGNVGVDLGGADVGVAQQFLNNAQVGAMLEEMGGEAVAQHVRSDVACNA